MPQITKTGPWDRTRTGLAKTAIDLPKILAQGIREEAEFMRDQARRGIRSGAPGGQKFRDLAAGTLRARALMGGSGGAPLRDSGELERAIQVVVRRGKAFAGVPAGTKGSDGRDLAKIAQGMEEGIGPFTVTITPAMQRFLAIVGGPAVSSAPSGGTFRMRIPARPVFGPVLRRFGKPGPASERMKKRVQRRLGPPFRG